VVGGAYVVFAICCGLAGGIIGRIKGSSFFIWFLLCTALPPVLLAVLLYRFDTAEPDTTCPGCGKRVKFYEALCTRCGTELDPGYTEQPASVVESRPTT
jgi:DNA-directed RNA polymerase subunit RPC12/RpoP